MLNIRKYNYFMWTEIIGAWRAEQNLNLSASLDLGCGSGEFLRQLRKLRLIREGTGVDLAVNEHTEDGLTFLNRDICAAPIDIEPDRFDAIFFMNMFFVLPTLDKVEAFLMRARTPNLVMSVPRANALDAFERRHPNVNVLSRDLTSWLVTIGYVKRRQSPACSHYYLTHPAQTIVGSLARPLAKIVDRMRDDAFYDIYWLTKSA